MEQWWHIICSTVLDRRENEIHYRVNGIVIHACIYSWSFMQLAQECGEGGHGLCEEGADHNHDTVPRTQPHRHRADGWPRWFMVRP